jgi:hypothetical protein
MTDEDPVGFAGAATTTSSSAATELPCPQREGAFARIFSIGRMTVEMESPETEFVRARLASRLVDRPFAADFPP